MSTGIQATTPTKIKKLSPSELQILWADGHETRHMRPGPAGHVSLRFLPG